MNYAPLPPLPLTKSGVQDLVDGLCRVRLWGRLGWLEVKRRYRRTLIGPFWSSLSLGVFVISLGTVGAGLWNQDLKEYLPYLTSGMLVWLMISASVAESCTLYVTGGNLFRQVRFDFSLLAFALVWRNAIVFLHHLAVYAVLVLLMAPGLITLHTFLVVPGLLLLMMNAVWISIVLGILCLRFRDVQQLVMSMLQISIFITPIFWPIDQLNGSHRMVFVEMNPLYHAVQLVRAPLLGKSPALASYLVVMVITLLGFALLHIVFGRFRKRIAYWS